MFLDSIIKYILPDNIVNMNTSLNGLLLHLLIIIDENF